MLVAGAGGRLVVVSYGSTRWEVLEDGVEAPKCEDALGTIKLCALKAVKM